MIAKVTLLCAVVAFAHAGAPIVSSIGLSGLGLASPLGLRSIGGLGLGTAGIIGAPGIGLRSAGIIGAPGLGLRSIGGLGLASPLGLQSAGIIGAPGIGLRSIGGLGLASPLGLRSAGIIGAPGIGLRSIGGLGLASPIGLRSAGIIGAPALGLNTIGGLGLGGLKVAAAAPVVAKAVVAAPAQPYEFGYSHHTDDGAASSRQEVSDAGNNKQGSYSIQNPDGTYRVVTYVADAAGFRAVVKTNEPGTAPQNPAATQILAEEPPYKVLPAAAPLVKTVGIAAAPTVIKTGVAGIAGLGAYGSLGGLGLVHG